MGSLLHVGAQVKCFHGIPAFRLTGMPRVKVGGQQVWTVESTLICHARLPVHGR